MAAAEALLEGAEYDAETEDVAGALEAAAALVRPPRPTNWGAMTKKQKKTGTTGNITSDASLSARTGHQWQREQRKSGRLANGQRERGGDDDGGGRSGSDGAKAAAEAESETDGARPKPANWGSMTKAQRESWKKNAQKVAKGKRPRGLSSLRR